MERFRTLRADEVECRVGQVAQNGRGLSLLLYKTSRTDSDILDESVGPENWQCRFEDHKGTLFCSVGIMTENGWVWKSDAGSPSNMESQKGEASDAFKRACFKWGIGRELYAAPFVWVYGNACSIVQGKGGKPTCRDRFRVTEFEVADGRVTRLQIVNDSMSVIAFDWGSNAG